ncbi:MAG: N-acetylmuramoyl-L-alanine amidase [Syntrophomonadaceae bacterium]
MTKVALIPGHGGFDPGAVNENNGVRECDGNLAVALKVKDLLGFNDFEVAMSRTTDEACGGAANINQDVNNQISFGNNSGADIAVAIHYNSASSSLAHGTEALYSQYNGLSESNIALARLLANEVSAATGLTNRGIKDTQRSVGVVRAINIPVALIECAFVSNDEESIWCWDPDHQLIIAKAVAKAVCEYFGKEYIDMTETTVTLNGKKLASGYLINNRNYVPIGLIAAALGLKVTWDAATKTVKLVQ